MKKNSRTSVALHALVHLSALGRPVTSEELGLCQQTNPVIIRQVLGALKKSHIVSSEKGHGGGWIMEKKPNEVSFQDIFEALDDSLLPDPIALDKDEHCLIMKTVATTMDEFLVEAEQILKQKLSKIRLSDITKSISPESKELFLKKNGMNEK